MASVDPKAVLEGRMPGRPPVGLIIGLMISSLCALIALGIDAFNGTSFFVGLILAILPVPLLIALILVLDRLEPEPWRTLLFAFMWGAGVAVLGSLILNTAGFVLITGPVFGEEEGFFVSAAVGAPLIEETLKGAVLFGLLWFRRNELDGLTDGIIYAAMVAVGFAMMENISYYIEAIDKGQLTAVFILRGVISPLGHPLFTSMTGLGVAYAALHRGAGRVLAPVAGLLGAMVLHGMWNGSTAFGLVGLGFVYLIDFVILVCLIVIVVVERQKTVQLIGRFLPAYASTGLVTPRDVRMLGRLPSRRLARQWARSVGGAAAGRAMGDYQLAATELALLHQRAERGVAEPTWFEQRRAALLQLMQLARQTFQRYQSQAGAPPWAGGGQSGFGAQPGQGPASYGQPSSGQSPYGQAPPPQSPPYGQSPYGQPPHGQPPYGQQPPYPPGR